MASENGVTSAAAWGASNEEVVQLPSGEKAKLRKKLNVWTLFRRGVMTPELLQAYEKAERGELDDLGMAIELNDLILAEMFVEPKVFVPEDDKKKEAPRGHVHVDQIDDEDVTFVLERAFRGARETGRFRGEPGGDGAGANGADVGEDSGGNGGPGDGDAARVPPRPPSSAKGRGKRSGRKSPTKKRSPAA